MSEVLVAGLGAGYLLGSIPFALIAVRLAAGKDVRAVGSGNVGATNALRAAGTAVGLLVLTLDAFKGVAGVLAGFAIAAADPWAGVVVAAPVLGHMFPIWLSFKGGKGVATALGVLVVADWRLLVAGLIAFLFFAVPTRFVSLGSIAAAATVGGAALWLHGWAPLSAGVVVVALLVIARHRDNIKRLIAGTEKRIGRSSKGNA